MLVFFVYTRQLEASMSVVALTASVDSVSSNNQTIHSKNSTTEAQQSSRQNNNKYFNGFLTVHHSVDLNLSPT
jgi:hypothetical protein